MENNTIPVNSVNISLSEYNVVKGNLDITRNLLSKAIAELDILRNQEAKNKLIVVERQERDQRYGGVKTIESLTFNVSDPEASNKILDVISKVETSELKQKIDEKENLLKSLKIQLDRKDDYIDDVLRANSRNIQTLEEGQEAKLHKITRKSEQQILELTEQKEDLVKSLSDLKKDKTKEQIELAHVNELEDLKDKMEKLENFKDEINAVAKNPFKLMRFINSARNASQFVEGYGWYSKLKSRTETALDRIKSFTDLIANVGKSHTKEAVSPSPQYITVGNSGYWKFLTQSQY